MFLRQSFWRASYLYKLKSKSSSCLFFRASLIYCPEFNYWRRMNNLPVAGCRIIRKLFSDIKVTKIRVEKQNERIERASQRVRLVRPRALDATHQHCPDRALGLARRTLLRATEEVCMLSNLTMNSNNSSQGSCDTPPMLDKFIPFIIYDEKYFPMINDSEWLIRSCI